MVKRYGYQAFGSDRFDTAPTRANVDRRFTGQIHDDDTGLYFYNARYYAPDIARFIQADSVLPTMASQGLNRYTYCANNPLIFTDPSGNVFVIDDILIAAAIGAVVGAACGGASAAIMGGNIGQGVAFGAIGGALGGAFANLGVQLAMGAQYAQGMAIAAYTTGGKIGAACGAMAAGALSAAITGGDPGISAITAGISAGIGMGINFDTGSGIGDWLAELGFSTGTGGLIGGIVAEVCGLEFRQGFFQGAACAASAFVISSLMPGIVNAPAKGAGEIMKGLLTRDLKLAFGGCLRMLGIPPDLFDFNNYADDDWSDHNYPKSVYEIKISVRSMNNADEDKLRGMKSWHAGIHAGRIRDFGPLALLWSIPASIIHETPLDWGSFIAEQQTYGTLYHIYDSVGDIGANTLGQTIGLILPASISVPTAMKAAAIIPGPHDKGPI